jgi:hypothetical protein
MTLFVEIVVLSEMQKFRLCNISVSCVIKCMHDCICIMFDMLLYVWFVVAQVKTSLSIYLKIRNRLVREKNRHLSESAFIVNVV